MCVVFPLNPFPFLEWILFIALGLLALALSSLLWIVYSEYSERTKAKESPRKSKPRRTTGNSGENVLLYPWIWTSTMLARPFAFFYHAFRRTFTSFSWWRSEQTHFDHKQLAYDSRWEKFWRERVLPADSEQLRSCIPLDLFPIVRQTQLGTIVAYSERYVQEVFARSSRESQGSPRERFVLVLRGPKSKNESNTEPRFKDVVTDMLQLKQVGNIKCIVYSASRKYLLSSPFRILFNRSTVVDDARINVLIEYAANFSLKRNDTLK